MALSRTSRENDPNGAAERETFLSGLLSHLMDQGRRLVSRRPAAGPAWSLAATGQPLPDLCRALLDRTGETAQVLLATEILARWGAADKRQKLDLLRALARDFGPSPERLERAIEAYQSEATPLAMHELHASAEPARQEVLRRLNLAPMGTVSLVRMREELLRHLKDEPDLRVLDADFVHLFASWFNRGFLVLRRVDWTTPASVLEKIIRYEAVHEIRGWSDLRRRLDPFDRRCFAFFHPQLADDPIIFVEVALTSEIPVAIRDLINDAPRDEAGDQINTAVFYSISNCHRGLQGISFGASLIRQVVEALKRELPSLETFVTLSPVPGFAAWLARSTATSALSAEATQALAHLDEADWFDRPEIASRLRPVLMELAARYLVVEKSPDGLPADPVARFHLGNGARLERLNFLADLSPKGVRQAHGLMVNYLYDLRELDRNYERFATAGAVAASRAVSSMVAPASRRRSGRAKAN